MLYVFAFTESVGAKVARVTKHHMGNFRSADMSKTRGNKLRASGYLTLMLCYHQWDRKHESLVYVFLCAFHVFFFVGAETPAKLMRCKTRTCKKLMIIFHLGQGCLSFVILVCC